MSVDLIVKALVTDAGASATATTAVKGFLRGRQAGCASVTVGEVDIDPVDELIATLEASPEPGPDAVAERLTQLMPARQHAKSGMAELLAAVRQLVDLVGAYAHVGKYHVKLQDNTGVQIGDRNEMTLNIDRRDWRRL